MRLIAIEYPECRLNFFKEQLAAANRRLDWSVKHNPDWNDNAEKGEVVSFYEWAVKMAESEADAEKTSDNKASDKKQATSEWISVKERLPEIVATIKSGVNTYKRSIRVLCACKQADGKRMVKEGYFEFFNDRPDPRWRIPGTIHSVTHWMPLPEPPKMDGGEDNA